MNCRLCEEPGGRLVLQTPAWRLVNAEEPGFPAFYRVVWNAHVREFSELAPAERHRLADVLAVTEQALLRQLSPSKVNLASLGNAVPHLHWHVIARFDWDSHFPGSVWTAPQRQVNGDSVAAVAARLPALEQELLSALAPLA